MEFLYFTAAGITLYLVSDWILRRIEARRGRLLEHRSVVFFFIFLVLAVSLFQLIQYLAGR